MDDTHSASTTLTEDLVRRARHGDEAAYDELFARAYPQAMLFIRMRTGPGLKRKLEPHDVLQEAYLGADRAFKRFEYRGPGSFSRWLCRIIENALRGLADHHGAKKRTPPAELARVSRVLNRIEASTHGPATRAAQGETNDRLVSGVDDLDGDQREVLLLRFFQDRTIDEIASVTGHSPTTTRRLLGRAVLALGEHLEAAP